MLKKYQPKTRDELVKLVRNLSINLGDIDTSEITDMSFLFVDKDSLEPPIRSDFSGIETWDTSKVTSMAYMFSRCTDFNLPLSFDTSNEDNQPL